MGGEDIGKKKEKKEMWQQLMTYRNFYFYRNFCREMVNVISRLEEHDVY